MLPTRLELRNFLAYRQPDAINFEDIHLACLTGPNGAGKSSLLDAITWALWGKARTRSDDDLIFQGQSEMLVQLDFLQGETLYRVVRKRQKGRTPRAPGRSTLNLFVFDDEAETWHPLDHGSLRETETAIVDLLRLDYDTFVNSAFLQQGQADSFTVKQPAQRKEILGKILGLDQWETFERRAKDQLGRIEHNLSAIELQIADIARREAEEPTLRHDLQLATELYDGAVVQRAEAEVRYQEVAGAEEQMNAARARLARAEHRLQGHQRDLNETEAEIERFQRQIAALRATVSEREQIEAGYAELQSARSVDQALGEKLQQITTIKDRLAQVERGIDSARADLERQATAHRTRIEQAARSADELEDLLKEQADVLAEIEVLTGEEARRDDLREEITALNEERTTRKVENDALFDEMNAIRERIARLAAAEATCPLCGQPLDDLHKAEVIAQGEAEGLARKETWIANKKRMEQLAATVTAHQQTIREIEGALKRLPELRARAGKLEARVDEARAAADVLTREGAALDAIAQTLESGEYALELQAQRETITAEIDTLGYDHDAHSAVRETLTTLAEYDRRQSDLRSALDRLPESEAALDYALSRRDRWLKTLEEERVEVAEAQTAIEALAELVQEAQRREEEVRQRRAEERQAFEQKTRAEQFLKALEQARLRKAELVAQQAGLTAERSVYQELRDAFGKNGVPAMIIEAVIPELEEAANALLSEMTDGRMHVRLDTQREKRTGGVAETLDILISDELGTRSYESYSGGEAFRVNFAIRVALSQMLARRAGAQLRTLFLDEGFGTQDEAGRQRLVEAINAVQDQFDLLLAITHIDELRDAFPVQIAVTKTPDGSRVELR